MISRRQLLQGALAASALSGLHGRAIAAGRLTQEELLRFPSIGNVTLVHLADIHAQLMPLHFREPSVNIGVGEAKGLVPHLTGKPFLDRFAIAAGSADAYALTDQDFAELAKVYGRMGGLDRIATVVKAIRAERGERMLLLDGGDTWTNSWTALQTKAQDMVEAMSLLAPDAMTGHWEFTLGEARVKEIVDGLPFSFLAQNIRDSEFEDPVFPAYEIFERVGVRVAVIGQAFPFTPIANPRWMIPRWWFGIRGESLQGQVDEVRSKGADLVVLLSHNGFDLDRKLARVVRGIDVILTGHTHDAIPEAVRVDRTLLASSGSHGKFVSRLDLDVRGREVKDFRFRLIPIFSDAIRPDAEMAELIARHRAPFANDLARRLGTAGSLLYRRGNFAGTLDDLFCEAMLSEREAEIALSPGFRWGPSLLPGQPITFEDITNACALSYPVCYRTLMTGARIKEVLEDVADNIFHPDPYYHQGGDMVRTGGLAFTLDIAAGPGKRISDLTLLRTGQRVEASREYVVAGWASVNEGTEGPPIWEVVARHVASRGTIDLRPRETVKVLGA
ncbi:MAG TPA: thiosulfohydrolase SoxB [Hyphomicrobiaceae bacterium]|nr:thiosulfohydrolase SoxB [Hyphomicrobiaceae bacterium]